MQLYQSLVNHINRHKYALKTKILHVEIHGIVEENQVLDGGDDLNVLETFENENNPQEDAHAEQIHEVNLVVNVPEKQIDLFELHHSIEKMQSLFTLKMCSKHSLSQEVVNDILSYSDNIHDVKLEFIKRHIHRAFDNEHEIDINKVVECIELTDSISGKFYQYLYNNLVDFAASANYYSNAAKLCNQVRSLSLFGWRTLTLLKI